MIRLPFVTNEIYHVYNRGVEKRKIFQTDKDRFRFIHCMREFNDEIPTLNMGYYYDQKNLPRKNKKPLVEILCFCIMPNHYHFLLKQKVDGGITLFMRKLGTGYTNYFNKKYERVGPLFQGRFKAILIKNEPHLLYLPHYIHLNPLDLTTPEWRAGGIKNINEAITYLKSYRWSSYLDYIDENNFPNLVQRDSMLKYYADRENESVSYDKELRGWLKNISIDQIKNVILE